MLYRAQEEGRRNAARNRRVQTEKSKAQCKDKISMKYVFHADLTKWLLYNALHGMPNLLAKLMPLILMTYGLQTKNFRMK